MVIYKVFDSYFFNIINQKKNHPKNDIIQKNNRNDSFSYQLLSFILNVISYYINSSDKDNRFDKYCKV